MQLGLKNFQTRQKKQKRQKISQFFQRKTADILVIQNFVKIFYVSKTVTLGWSCLSSNNSKMIRKSFTENYGSVYNNII